MQVRYRGLCAIGSGLWTRNTHFEDVCSSSAHDLTRSSLYAKPEWSNGHGERFKEFRPLRTANPGAMLRVVHNRLRALGSKHTLLIGERLYYMIKYSLKLQGPLSKMRESAVKMCVIRWVEEIIWSSKGLDKAGLQEEFSPIKSRRPGAFRCLQCSPGMTPGALNKLIKQATAEGRWNLPWQGHWTTYLRPSSRSAKRLPTPLISGPDQGALLIRIRTAYASPAELNRL